MTEQQPMTPVRLRLSRAKGFDLQALSLATNGLPAVRVDHSAIFGTPFTAKGCREAGYTGDDKVIAARCVRAYRTWIDSPYWAYNWMGEESVRRRKAVFNGLHRLRWKNLACWCALDVPCHADVLLDIANRPICEPV